MESDAFPRINRVIVTGFIQQQPELRHTPSGVPVSSFRVRTGRLVRDRRGAGARDLLHLHGGGLAGSRASGSARRRELGQGVTVEGSLHSRSFVAGNGERRTVLEVYADSLETVAGLPVAARAARGRGGARRGAASRREDRPGGGAAAAGRAARRTPGRVELRARQRTSPRAARRHPGPGRGTRDRPRPRSSGTRTCRAVAGPARRKESDAKP